MNKPYDRTKDISFEMPTLICRSGVGVISTENTDFFQQGVIDLATHYGVEKLHYERMVDGGGAPVSDKGEILPSEMDLRPGDTIQFVTVFYGECARRYIVVRINEKEYEKEWAMTDKFVYALF